MFEAMIDLIVSAPPLARSAFSVLNIVLLGKGDLLNSYSFNKTAKISMLRSQHSLRDVSGSSLGLRFPSGNLKTGGGRDHPLVPRTLGYSACPTYPMGKDIEDPSTV